MRKVLVFQHVANKILGTLNPTIKEHGLRIRYVNFERNPDERPTLDKYDGLIILGGHMGVYEADRYQHIRVELQLIEEALKKGIPILGICLGAQLIATVLGSQVRRHTEKEIGWYDLKLTDQGKIDSLFSHFDDSEKVFQIHGDTFDIPKDAVHLGYTESCNSQAFRYGEKVYGLQFHLEVDENMIYRWLAHEANLKDILESNGKFNINRIKDETSCYISRSEELSLSTFAKFASHFNLKHRPNLLGSGHSKPLKKSLLK